MRAPLVVALLVSATFAGCTDSLTFGSTGGTLESPKFSVVPESGDAQTLFRVDAGKLGDKHELTWDFGDGTVRQGKTAEHTYGFTNGVMTITLIATDTDGKQGFTSRTVTLGTGTNADPTTTLRATKAWVEVGQPATLSASASDRDRDPLSYLWSWKPAEGGAETIADATDPKASIAFDAPGRYAVKVRVSDPKGGEAIGETFVDVSTKIPDPRIQETYNGTLAAGSAGSGASEALWGLPLPPEVPDTNVDSARHAFRLDYPAYGFFLLAWEDPSTQGAFDLDLELQDGSGAPVFTSATRAPAPPFEMNMTQLAPGDYTLVVRAVTGAQISYTLQMVATLQLTPELVAAAEAG